MLRYFRILQSFIYPNYRKIKDMYFEDISNIIKYLYSLSIDEHVKFELFLKNVCKTVQILKIDNFTAYKVALYKKWDLRKEFIPTDIAWLLVDDKNNLKLISYDKDIFYLIVLNKILKVYY